MLVQTFKDYLQETLGIQTQPIPWTNAKVLPFLLRDRYEFLTIPLLRTKCLLMVPKGRGEETPAVVRKHWQMVKEKWTDEVIYVPQELTSFNRKRLIQQKVPFVVPGTQLYLPDLGMDLREHFKKSNINQEAVSPATQVIILDALLNGRHESRIGTQLAAQFGYSTMTITRALKEIETFGLGTVQTQGKERRLKFDLTRRDLWEKALPAMRDPVRKRIWLLKGGVWKNEAVIAGLTALSKYSKLAEPEYMTFAVSAAEYKALRKRNDIVPIQQNENNNLCLEVWSYSPKRLARDGVMDPFSLYTTLVHQRDERIESALEEMMEAELW